ncbi:hypothetical protein LLO_1339 [Legionella longbeachae NSW150]|uniref:Uncharacterized protein n=1 Tax=Legionella longbeachae serogroup 1 (strain NSW150) TaxID=661367 RepID=D3HS19_LEGLN|nr:hypothetical protein LLO_1339 [Legionella longbeachae NSW150]
MESNIVPNPMTLQKAREQVKSIVIYGLSLLKIKRYLHRWCHWWGRTSLSWLYPGLLLWFLKACWDRPAAGICHRTSTITRIVLNGY